MGAHGALLLVPVTAKEVADAGLHLRAHHIVALPEDREHINQALAAIPRRQKRPKLVNDCRPSFSAAASDGSTRELQDEQEHLCQGASGWFKVTVEKTFITVRSLSQGSTYSVREVRSAP